MTAPIRTGIVGYGRMAEGHARRMRESGLYQVAAVADPTPARREAAGRDLGATVVDTAEQLLNEDVELVLVTTHSSAHFEPALAAIRAGKHVLLEKPMTLTGDEAQALVEAGKAAGTLLSVYHQRRWDPDYRQVKKAVREGVLGELFLVENRTAGAGPAVRFGAPEFRQEWRVTRAMGGGTLYDFGPHWIDQLLDLVGGPVTGVLADVRHFRHGDAEDYFDLKLIFENGCRATASKCDLAYVSWPKWIVLGTQGSIRHDQETLVRTAERAYFELEGVPAEDLHRNVALAIREGAPLLVTGEDGLRVLRVIDAAFRSAETGELVEVRI